MGRRNRYRAENREEELEDELQNEEAENENENIDAEDDETDPNAEDEDDDINAEDDELDPDAEGEDLDPDAEDEDEPKSKRAKAVQMRERRRSAGLTQLAKIARRLGVKFDASAAIANGTSLSRAKTRVLNAAAARDRKMNVSPHTPNSERRFGGASRAQTKAMWKKAKGKK